MRPIQKRKIMRSMAVGMSLIFCALAIHMYVPLYVEYWQQSLGWILSFLIIATCISSLRNMHMGNTTEKLPLLVCFRKIIFSDCVLLLFICGFFILMTSNVVSVSPEQLLNVIKENMAHSGYFFLFYPWILYLFAAILFGSLGALRQKPKISGIIANLIPSRYLSPFLASVIDYMAIFGFYLSMLVLTGVTVLVIAQLMAYVMGYRLDFHLDITIMGLAFSLTYLPVSNLWKAFKKRIERRGLNPGAALLLLTVVFSLFVIGMYAILHIFMFSMAGYFTKIEQHLPQVDFALQISEMNMAHLLWGFGMITMAVIGSWWSQLVAGYRIWQAVLLLLAPLVVVGTIGTLVFSYQWDHQALSLITWMWGVPQAYILSLIPVCILVTAIWKKTQFSEALFMVFPNESGHKLSRLRKIIIDSAVFIGYAVMFNLMMGLHFAESILLTFAIFFSFALPWAIMSYTQFMITRRIL